MDKKKFSVTILLELEPSWAQQFTAEEVKEQIEVRVKNALGFRAQVKQIEISDS